MGRSITILGKGRHTGRVALAWTQPSWSARDFTYFETMPFVCNDREYVASVIYDEQYRRWVIEVGSGSGGSYRRRLREALFDDDSGKKHADALDAGTAVVFGTLLNGGF